MSRHKQLLQKILRAERMPISASAICVVCFGIWDSPSGYEEAITYSDRNPRVSVWCWRNGASVFPNHNRPAGRAEGERIPHRRGTTR